MPRIFPDMSSSGDAEESSTSMVRLAFSSTVAVSNMEATAMMATPTYVLGMAEIASSKLGMDPARMSIRKITCAGEPGASIPSTKRRMEAAWGAKVYDQVGSTEIGHWGWECRYQHGLHVNLYLDDSIYIDRDGDNRLDSDLQRGDGFYLNSAGNRLWFAHLKL